MDDIKQAIGAIKALRDGNYDEFKEVMAGLLLEVDPLKPFGTALFDSIARLSYNIAFEAVALRKNPGTGKVEVYLRKRSMNDSAYPGEWHCPGTMIRPYEVPKDQAKRLEAEFGVKISNYRRITGIYTAESRGPVLSEVYLVELSGPPREDESHLWFPVDALPDTTVNIHRDLILPQALVHYHNI